MVSSRNGVAGKKGNYVAWFWRVGQRPHLVVLLMALLLTCLGCVTPLYEGVLGQADVSEDVVFENRFFRAVVSPAAGAGIIELVEKTTGRNVVGRDGVLLGDQILEGGSNRPCELGAFAHQLSVTEDGATVVFTAQAISQGAAVAALRKTYRVRGDSPVIVVHYEYRNAPGSTTDADLAFRVRNVLPPGKAYLPMGPGTKITTEAGQTVAQGAKAGWLAATMADDGPGVVFTMEAAQVESCRSASGAKKLELDWTLERRRIALDTPLTTDVTVTPIAKAAELYPAIRKADAILMPPSEPEEVEAESTKPTKEKTAEERKP